MPCKWPGQVVEKSVSSGSQTKQVTVGTYKISLSIELCYLLLLVRRLSHN